MKAAARKGGRREISLGQLAPCEPAQLAFEIQALLGAGSHQYRLRRDPQAIARAETAVRQRLESLRALEFPRCVG